MIRSAVLNDLPDLIDIENRCFDSDRISPRSFRYILTKANAETLVAVDNGVLLGYVMVFFRTGTSLARMYSFAVDTAFRRQGVGSRLLAAAEKMSTEHGCAVIRLEVRPDNRSAIRTYADHGYRQFAIMSDYYEDHSDALRFQKNLPAGAATVEINCPYYEQSLDFTCGPSALMMAMKSLDSSLPLSRQLELRIWRDSTSIFMASGHGGCGPYGLALAALKRGFGVDIYVNDKRDLFVDSVRDQRKKKVIRLVQNDMLDELKQWPVEIYHRPLSLVDMEMAFRQGGVPVVLISSYRIYGEKSPHWVVVTGLSESHIFVNDPFVDNDQGRTRAESMHLPILRTEFERMVRYGKAGLKAALVLTQGRSADV